MENGGATLLLEIWQRENQESGKWKAFFVTVGIKCADLKDEFLFYIFTVYRHFSNVCTPRSV